MSEIKRRVVVTGLGAVTPIGIGLEAFSEGLKKGICGAGPISVFDTAGFPFKTAHEVKGFDPRERSTQAMDPFIQYAVAAAAQAVEDAQLDFSRLDPYRIGLSVSSSKGGVHTLDRFKDRFQKNPSAILGARIYTNAVPNFAAQWIARRWKISGPAKCYVAACATGTVAVCEGARMVEDGTIDYCIAGASDASLVPLMLAGYHNMKALTLERLRPFDKKRSGFLVGEGAGLVVLETFESARARGAKIYGEILGSRYGAEPHDGIKFDLKSDALSRTLRGLCEVSSIRADEIDYVNLHGTGTVHGDLYETVQMKQFFGKKAYQIPMSSIKGMTGHMLGASGAVEIIASLLGMKEGYAPATVGLERPDPACDLDYIPGVRRALTINTAVSVSMGFGGHVAAIALGKV